MRHFMICVSGFSGTGKDEICGQLLRAHGGVQTGLADPAKRHMADVYGFTEHQLYGPSSARNEGDLRYPKEAFHKYGLRRSTHMDGEYGKVEKHGFNEECIVFPGLEGGSLDAHKNYWVFEGRNVPEAQATMKPCKLPKLGWQPLKLGNTRYFVPEGDPRFWLCCREPLQDYCELMNKLYLRTWSRKGVEIHRKLAEVRWRNPSGGIHAKEGDNVLFRYTYSRMEGLVENDHHEGVRQGLWTKSDGTFISCFADFRHWHELAEANDAEGLTAVLIRVKRPSVPEPPYDHRSETEQAEIDDFYFDFVLDNDGTLEELYAKVDGVVAEVKSPGWEPTRDRRP